MFSGLPQQWNSLVALAKENQCEDTDSSRSVIIEGASRGGEGPCRDFMVLAIVCVRVCPSRDCCRSLLAALRVARTTQCAIHTHTWGGEGGGMTDNSRGVVWEGLCGLQCLQVHPPSNG